MVKNLTMQANNIHKVQSLLKLIRIDKIIGINIKFKECLFTNRQDLICSVDHTETKAAIEQNPN